MRALAAPLLVLAAQALPDRPDAPVVLTGQPEQGALLRGTARPDVVALTLAMPGAADVPVTLDGGRFVIGFDRDAGEAATLTAQRADGSIERVSLSVQPRAWPRQRVNLDPRMNLGSAFAARRPAELAQIAAARALDDADLTGWREPFRPPVAGRVAPTFGAGRVYRGGYESVHSGADIAAATGTPVVAPASGRVVLAAATPFTLEGNLLIVDHGAGLSSAFLHLSRIDVRVGETVAAGQPIGAVGATGRATGPHLHWSLRWRDARVDPAALIGR